MIALDVLAQLACGDLSGDDERAAEEHVLGCGGCARTLEGLLVAGAAVRSFIESGRSQAYLPMTGGVVDLLDAAGLITRRYRLTPGSEVACTVDARDVYLAASIEGDLRGLGRLDVELGGYLFADVAFEPDRGRVIFLAPAGTMRPMPTMKIPVRAVGYQPDGRQRVVGEYTLSHTAFSG